MFERVCSVWRKQPHGSVLASLPWWRVGCALECPVAGHISGRIFVCWPVSVPSFPHIHCRLIHCHTHKEHLVKAAWGNEICSGSSEKVTGRLAVTRILYCIYSSSCLWFIPFIFPWSTLWHTQWVLNISHQYLIWGYDGMTLNWIRSQREVKFPYFFHRIYSILDWQTWSTFALQQESCGSGDDPSEHSDFLSCQKTCV